jgi:hypothetical protein
MRKKLILLIIFTITFSASSCSDSSKSEPDKITIPGFIEVGKNVTVDLNGDGKNETVYYGLEDFKVNGVSYKDLIQYNVYENNPLSDNYIITDIQTSDSQREIGLMVAGPSNDPAAVFFTYNGEKLVEIGSIPSEINNLSETFDGKGNIFGTLRLSILQTWWAPAEWELSSNHVIQLKEQSVYYPVQYTDLPIKLNVPLPIYENAGDTEPVTTLNPQEVSLTATDNKNWCRVEGSDGTKGWFRIDNFSTVTDLGTDASSVFSNLCMAD